MLELYKMFVDLTDRLAERRGETNKFFQTLNTALLGVLGVMSAAGLERVSAGWALAVSIGGGICCVSWWRLVGSYRQLSSRRFDVIHELEESLLYPLFTREWELLGEGKDVRKYRSFTQTEAVVPWVFFGLHVLLGVWAALGIFGCVTLSGAS